MRYWYGNNAGFSVLTVSDAAPRQIRPVADARNVDGPVRRYPVPWRSCASGRADEPLVVSDDPSAETAAPDRVLNDSLNIWPRAGRRITYHPELTRREAAKLRDRERRQRAAREQA